MISTVIECADLDTELAFFTGSLGFRIDLVTPADDPSRIVVEREGTTIELRRTTTDVPVRLVMTSDDPPVDGRNVVTSPGGSTVQRVMSNARVTIPDGAATLSVVPGEPDGDHGFGVGRAGMEYRDLLPDRWGGRFIASHIRVGEGGDVADWVHFHRIRFQMIYVAAGWVDVVYEDQGPPFRMEAGDCVLQPPEIRHRVLRSSSGAEVIEIGCPAEHDTISDHDLDLPTAALRADRDFAGQRFVRHRGAGAPTTTWVDPSLRVRDTGIGHATDGLAGVIAVSSGSDTPVATSMTHDGEFALIVALAGTATLELGDETVELTPRTAVALPPATVWCWTSHQGHEALVVTLPAGAIRPA